VRTDALARRPADGLRRVTDPLVFVLAMQVGAHAIWKTFALPEAALPVVIEVAGSCVALSRMAAIARLARLYRVTADVDISRPVAGASLARPRMSARSHPSADAATQRGC
jgi:hypothetical protein